MANPGVVAIVLKLMADDVEALRTSMSAALENGKGREEKFFFPQHALCVPWSMVLLLAFKLPT